MNLFLLSFSAEILKENTNKNDPNEKFEMSGSE